MSVVHSNQNKKFKLLKKLKTKKHRISEKKIILEGYRIINQAIKNGKSPFFIVYRDDFEERLRASSEDIVLDKALFDMVSSTTNSQGVIAVFDMAVVKKEETESNHIVVIDKVQDPGNLGTIIRTCDAFGFDKLILTKGTTDPYSDKCLRSTLSSIFNVNMMIGMEDVDVVNYLNKNNYDILLTTPVGEVDIVDCQPLQNMAIVIGSESNGASEIFFDVAKVKLKIAMRSSQESLNVACATSIVLHKLK